MIINLPVVEKAFNESTGEVDVKRSELKVKIDTSFKSHLKWEEQFQAQKGVDLATMTTQVIAWSRNKKEALRHMTDMLRVLYCYINSDDLPNFSDFIGILEPENSAEVIEKITKVLSETGKTAAKN